VISEASDRAAADLRAAIEVAERARRRLEAETGHRVVAVRIEEGLALVDEQRTVAALQRLAVAGAQEEPLDFAAGGPRLAVLAVPIYELEEER